MTRFFAFLLCAIGLIGTASADPSRPVLVELFANQNCPACPKAHRTMQQILDERDDVFILTWTVNYWDYLGEPDPMALPSAKQRQLAYTDRLSLRAPYTPQSFYDGAKECPGTRRRDIRRNIEARMGIRTSDVASLKQENNLLHVRGASEEAYEVSIVEYLSGDANPTSMVNPVTGVRSLGLWLGEDTAYDYRCKDSCVALLHEQDFGEVLAVLKLK